MNFHYFSKFRGIKPKIDNQLTNSIQRYPSLESKKSWLLFRGNLWRPLSERALYLLWCNIARVTEQCKDKRYFSAFPFKTFVLKRRCTDFELFVLNQIVDKLDEISSKPAGTFHLSAIINTTAVLNKNNKTRISGGRDILFVAFSLSLSRTDCL